MTSITALQLELDQLGVTRSSILTKELKALTNSILPFFSEFTPGVDIEVFRNSVYFKMDHPEYSYKKELFSIYLRENWDFEGEGKSYSSVDLSYYTTSTSGVDSWELRRLQLLGVVAGIIHDHHDEILEKVNNDSLRFKKKYREVYQYMEEIQFAIRELRRIEDEKVKRVIRESMFAGDVIKFSKDFSIDFKYNYSALILDIKMINISKSGKTADAIFTYRGGEDKGRAENINVEKLIDQIFHVQNIQSS